MAANTLTQPRGTIIVDTSALNTLVIPLDETFAADTDRLEEVAGQKVFRLSDILFALADRGFEVVIPSMIAMEAGDFLPDGSHLTKAIQEERWNFMEAFFNKVHDANNRNIRIEGPPPLPPEVMPFFTPISGLLTNGNIEGARNAVNTLREELSKTELVQKLGESLPDAQKADMDSKKPAFVNALIYQHLLTIAGRARNHEEAVGRIKSVLDAKSTRHSGELFCYYFADRLPQERRLSDSAHNTRTFFLSRDIDASKLLATTGAGHLNVFGLVDGIAKADEAGKDSETLKEEMRQPVQNNILAAIANLKIPDNAYARAHDFNPFYRQLMEALAQRFAQATNGKETLAASRLPMDDLSPQETLLDRENASATLLIRSNGDLPFCSMVTAMIEEERAASASPSAWDQATAATKERTREQREADKKAKQYGEKIEEFKTVATAAVDGGKKADRDALVAKVEELFDLIDYADYTLARIAVDLVPIIEGLSMKNDRRPSTPDQRRLIKRALDGLAKDCESTPDYESAEVLSKFKDNIAAVLDVQKSEGKDGKKGKGGRGE